MKRFLVTILEGPELQEGRELAAYEVAAKDFVDARLQGLSRYKHQHPRGQADFHATAKPLSQ
jgi:hypothetical protein